MARRALSGLRRYRPPPRCSNRPLVTQNQARGGLLLGFSAYLLWGVLPLYFKAIHAVGPIEIVSHRIVWSLFFLGALATVWKKWSGIRAALATPRLVMTLMLTASLIGVNWLVYIYAVVSGHVLEGSLGYYLNPLVNVLLGVVLLKERLSLFQKLAVGLAAVGVAILAAGAGSALWISLTLAATFASYGYFRKVAPVDALEGLSIETILLCPLALGYLLWVQNTGESGFLRDRTTDILLILGGAITAVPLLLFTAAARRLPYSTLGFLQYVAPSLQFLLAVLVFGEPLTTSHLICFGLIWTALVVFIVEGVRAGRASMQARREEAALSR
ncbi:EamA family transporter RarD [Sphingomonas deserti]|uniref:EamA family transporter RarD n=1 Tax=Allosphingosinicella deserti TaxID=2116704 RepID=A0A2P7QHX0_9SPHN|nr:EamA family transporter RarD [Sphingomonas deserti]